MSEKFVFTMNNVKKVYPPDRTVIKGMNLSFFPGAKIGVIGANGSGKSTLLKIIAGVETEYFGDIWRADKVTFGYLPQEPTLDESLDVKGNVELAVKDLRDKMDTYNELNMKLCEDITPEEMEQILAEVAEVQDAIEAARSRRGQ